MAKEDVVTILEFEGEIGSRAWTVSFPSLRAVYRQTFDDSGDHFPSSEEESAARNWSVPCHLRRSGPNQWHARSDAPGEPGAPEWQALPENVATELEEHFRKRGGR